MAHIHGCRARHNPTRQMGEQHQTSADGIRPASAPDAVTGRSSRAASNEAAPLDSTAKTRRKSCLRSFGASLLMLLSSAKLLVLAGSGRNSLDRSLNATTGLLVTSKTRRLHPRAHKRGGGVDGDTRPNGSRRATPRKADSRFDSGPLPCFTAKRLVSAQRVPTCPTHADAPVPQQITAIGDDGTPRPTSDRTQARKRWAFSRCRRA